METAKQPSLLFESEDWLVVDKPAGWLSIPPSSPESVKKPVLSEFLREKYGDVLVVHRLDVETSGIIVFARNAAAHKKCNQWFEDRQIKKIYLCLAQGNPAMPILKISTPIGNDRASTQVEVRESFVGSFLARVRIVTGRRHQIRIHLSKEGYPLLGDLKYGGPQSHEKISFERVALHAYELEFPDGKNFRSPIPADFEGWLGKLRALPGNSK